MNPTTKWKSNLKFINWNHDVSMDLPSSYFDSIFYYSVSIKLFANYWLATRKSIKNSYKSKNYVVLTSHNISILSVNEPKLKRFFVLNI